MDQNKKLISQSRLTELFDSAVWFDEEKVLNLFRKEGRKFPEDWKRELFKGFSRPDKISFRDLQINIRNMLKNKSKYDFAYPIIKYTILKHFYQTIIPLFKAISASDFLKPIEHRIKEIIALICRQTGWSVGIVKSILRYDPNFLIKFMPDQKTRVLDDLEDIDGVTDVFTPALTKNIVTAWRRNFPYDPYTVYGGIAFEEEEIESQKWSLIKGPALEKDMNGTASMLLELLDQESEDVIFIAEGSVDLVLLGIDLNKNELISKGIKKLEEDILKNPPSNPSLLRICTTMALGYAFLNNFDRALESVTLMGGEELSPEVLGFIGTLASMANRTEEAITLFSLAFKKGSCPFRVGEFEL